MSSHHRKTKNWLEWAIFGTGLVLVSGILAYLTYSAFTSRTGPPQIEVQLGQPRKLGHDFAVPVVVTNRGHATAEGVHIQVTLHKSNGTPETADFQVQFVPRGSTRHGIVMFETNPAHARDLIPRVLGYQRP
jgi:uncharacterized protein (TIGR02588 family)